MEPTGWVGHQGLLSVEPWCEILTQESHRHGMPTHEGHEVCLPGKAMGARSQLTVFWKGDPHISMSRLPAPVGPRALDFLEAYDSLSIDISPLGMRCCPMPIPALHFRNTAQWSSQVHSWSPIHTWFRWYSHENLDVNFWVANTWERWIFYIVLVI